MNFNDLIQPDIIANSIYLSKSKEEQLKDFHVYVTETVDELQAEYFLKKYKRQIEEWLREHDGFYDLSKYQIFFNKETNKVEINSRDSVYLKEGTTYESFIQFNIVLGKFYYDKTQIRPGTKGYPRIITGE